jgi:hypothetical protein
MKKIKAKLEWTSDYSIFDMHPCNRPLHDNKVLEKSMRDNGFMPSSPLQCVRNGGSKLKVIRGHHRLNIAKRLGIPVCYVIDETNTNIFDLEGSSTTAWNAPDFAYARARSGDVHMRALLDFKDKHGLNLGSAASLLGGQSAGSGNKVREIKSGTFRVSRATKHADQVVAITDILRSKNVHFATSTGFVTALSKVLRVPELDYGLLTHRIRINYHLLTKRGTAREYLTELEEIYNYGAKGKKRMPLAFRADEVARERSAINISKG